MLSLHVLVDDFTCLTFLFHVDDYTNDDSNESNCANWYADNCTCTQTAAAGCCAHTVYTNISRAVIRTSTSTQNIRLPLAVAVRTSLLVRWVASKITRASWSKTQSFACRILALVCITCWIWWARTSALCETILGGRVWIICVQSALWQTALGRWSAILTRVQKTLTWCSRARLARGTLVATWTKFS